MDKLIWLRVQASTYPQIQHILASCDGPFGAGAALFIFKSDAFRHQALGWQAFGFCVPDQKKLPDKGFFPAVIHGSGVRNGNPESKENNCTLIYFSSHLLLSLLVSRYSCNIWTPTFLNLFAYAHLVFFWKNTSTDKMKDTPSKINNIATGKSKLKSLKCL